MKIFVICSAKLINTNKTDFTNTIQINKSDGKDQTDPMDLFFIKMKCNKFHKIRNKHEYII